MSRSPDSEPDPKDASLDAGLRAIFDQMLEGVQIVDHEFRYRYLNEAAARHGHRHRDELLGHRMTDVFPGIDQTEMFGRLATCLDARTPQRMSNEFTYPDGGLGWFDLHMAPVPDGVLILSIDVTNEKRANQELRRSVQALEEADRRKSEFLAMLAHELRNPLGPIQNGLHVLRAPTTTAAEATTITDMMLRQVRLLARFVDDLLDVNRLAHGKFTMVPGRVDLARVIHDLAGDQRAAFEERGLTLRLDVPDAPVWVNGDPARLAQILMNVLDNAVKFTPPGGNATVSLERPTDGAVDVIVHDSGIGIRADVLPLVLEPLFQADTSIERALGGLGLGLTVAKGLAELHGGALSVASEGLGHGTTIRLTLPRLAELPAVAPRVPPAHEPPLRESPPPITRVLVIEDNHDAAKTLAMILRVWGYQVQLAYSGPDGIAQALQAPPDIIVSDIGLPGMDGYGVARALRSDDRTKRVGMIAISGYGRSDDRERAIDVGFDVHLQKPVNPDLLRAELKLLVSKH